MSHGPYSTEYYVMIQLRISLSGVRTKYGRHTRIWNSDFDSFEKIFWKYFLTWRSRTHIIFYFSDFEKSKSEIIKIIFLTSIFSSQKNKKKYEFDFAKSEKYFFIWVRLHQIEEIFFYIFLISPNRTRSQNSNYEFEKGWKWTMSYFLISKNLIKAE